MNDLPQNELFSAYLDGELTAAEQAEIERLLATSPAARQLLDELRALSSTLQALPQEKLGEDLSRPVLRAAERRMLTEGEPGETEPVPLAWSVFRRFLTRRNLVWLSLTTAIALIIVIDGRRQGMGPVQVARQMPVASESGPAREPGPPPSIRARDARDDESRSGMEAVAKRKSESAPSADKPVPEGFAAGAARPAASAPPETAPAAPPRSVAKAAPVQAKGGQSAGKAGGGFGGRQDDSNPSLGGPGDFRGEHYVDKATESGGQSQQAQQSSVGGEGMLVVRCNISPKAVQRQAFPKLLAANGMAWQEPRAEDRSAVVTGSRSRYVAQPKAAVPQAGSEMKAGKTAAKDAKRLPGAETWLPSDAEGDVHLVYVEATTAQIEATLAGFKAQPDVFLSFSINPPPGELPPAAQAFQQRMQAPGSGAGRRAVGHLDAVVREQTRQQFGANESQSVVISAENKRQGGGQMPRQLIQSSLRQQVLFVLHVADGQSPPVAAKAPARIDADSAKPAEPTGQPVAAPAPKK